MHKTMLCNLMVIQVLFNKLAYRRGLIEKMVQDWCWNHISFFLIVPNLKDKIISLLKIVIVLHQNKGSKSIPDAQEISRDPRDFPMAKPKGNFEVPGKSQGRRGWIYQYLPSFGGVLTFSSSAIRLQGWIRKSIPVGQGRIASLKINPSLLRMRE